MKLKHAIAAICLVVFVGGVYVVYTTITPFSSSRSSSPTVSTSVQFVKSVITADGIVTAQDQAKLNFPSSGKLIYLPLKEGDSVSVGQTIAQLDTYQLQRQLNAALNNYRTVRNSFDQTQDNVADNVQKAQLNNPYNYYSKAGMSMDSQEDAINNAIKRIVDQSQSNLDNSVIQVELANYALQFSRLISPIKGIVTHQDVNIAGINITPATTFIIADPDSMVFRANVPTESIYYVSVGSEVDLAIDGLQKKVKGTVAKIYPSKVILSNGQSVYQVDIQSEELKKLGKLDEAGRAMVSTHSKNVALVPAWTVLGGKYIWVEHGGKPELRRITPGKIHGNNIEILNGLSTDDSVIVDPKYIPSFTYHML